MRSIARKWRAKSTTAQLSESRYRWGARGSRPGRAAWRSRDRRPAPNGSRDGRQAPHGPDVM